MKILTTTNGIPFKVDDECVDFVMKNGPWYAGQNTRVHKVIHTKRGQETLYLAHLLIGIIPGMVVDHIDRDPFNNQKSNLRHVTYSESVHNTKRRSTNTTGFKGVTYDKDRRKFRARIIVGGVKYELGLFHTAEDAGKAYAEKASSLVGACACRD